MFSGLLVFLFVKLLYYTSYFFKKLGPILHPILFYFIFFCVLLNLWFEKIEILSNSIDVRLAPYLDE